MTGIKKDLKLMNNIRSLTIRLLHFYELRKPVPVWLSFSCPERIFYTNKESSKLS